jgi:hypothetical protein
VFSNLHYQEISANIRLNWTFAPNLSLQLYVQPLISSGDYYNFKQLSRPKSDEYLEFGTNGSSISYDKVNTEYEFDSDGSAGSSAPKKISDPDFNYKSLRGNAVVRWEYLPGSTMYFVWTQSRSDNEVNGELQFGRSFDRLISAKVDNIFLIKMSYYFNM